MARKTLEEKLKSIDEQILQTYTDEIKSYTDITN